MNNQITSDEVSLQFAKAIKLFLDFLKQENPIGGTQPLTRTPPGTNTSVPTRQEPERLLRVGEVAKVLQISRSAVYRLIQLGEIPSMRFGEKIIRVRQKDLEAIVNQGRK